MADPQEPEEEYHSASDEDFSPTAEPEASDISSSEDDETAPVSKAPKRRFKRPIEDEFDSGDEVTIHERKRKRRKGDGDADFSDDETGEGGLIKTRAQRARETKERRPLARTDGATADIDSIWASLSSAPIGRPPSPLPTRGPTSTKPSQDKPSKENGAGAIKAVVGRPEEDFITITRTYKFAGEVHLESKRVLKISEEARLWLASKKEDADMDKENAGQVDGDDAQPPQDANDGTVAISLRRPLKRPSRFEPNPAGEVKGLPPELQLRWPRTHPSITVPGVNNAATGTETGTGKGKQKVKLGGQPTKLNTVDKSRLDWVGYVDKEGMAEELDEYGRSKGAYGARMEFLERVEGRKEDERRVGRAKV